MSKTSWKKPNKKTSKFPVLKEAERHSKRGQEEYIGQQETVPSCMLNTVERNVWITFLICTQFTAESTVLLYMRKMSWTCCSCVGVNNYCLSSWKSQNDPFGIKMFFCSLIHCFISWRKKNMKRLAYKIVITNGRHLWTWDQCFKMPADTRW